MAILMRYNQSNIASLLKAQIKPTVAILMLLGLSACSIFGGGEIDLDEPAKLQKFTPELKITKVWSQKLGKGPGDIYPLSIVAVDGDMLFAADRTGTITAINLSNGKRVWKQEIKNTFISGATGASDGLVLVGTGQGEIIALSQETGETLWTSTVSSEVLAPPVTNGDTVVVLSVDGKVQGLNATDGSALWLADTNMPLLTVRGNSAPVIARNLLLANGARTDVVFIGLDNGKLVAYAVADGVGLWEARIGVPEGTTDLERMVDVDGIPLFINGTVYAVSLQGGLMAVQPDTGRTAWYQEASSNNGAGGYAGTVVITETDGTVRAFNAAEGTELWTTTEYANRSLNAPAVSSGYVAFADFEGQLHFLSRRSGTTIGRKKVDGSGVRSPTMIHNDQVIVLDNSGGISAYDVTELK